MKHGKKPTVKQCEFIHANKLNSREWLICKDTPSVMVLVHRTLQTIKEIRKR